MLWTDVSQSQVVFSFESQSWVKVKVVKWCLVYIYHQQCEILQKILWNSSSGQFQWFPIDFQWQWSKRYPNYANTSAFFSDWNIFKKVSSQGIPCLSWHPELSRYVIVGHVVHVGHLLPLHVGQHVHLHVGHFFCQLPCWLPCQPTCRPPQCRLAAFGDADRMEICV